MAWKDKKVTDLEILSKAGLLCKLEIEGKFKVTEGGKKVAFKTNKDGSLQFETTKGKTYQVVKI
jgi:hypothetical protein